MSNANSKSEKHEYRAPVIELSDRQLEEVSGGISRRCAGTDSCGITCGSCISDCVCSFDEATSVPLSDRFSDKI